MKRLLPILLVMLAVLMPTKVWAEDSAAEPYAVLTNDTLLTFYYDDQKSTRGGMDINTRSWNIENGEESPYGGITKAVFDASFANYRPTSTAYWFQGCRNMTTVEGMENLNTSNVTSMWAMFDWCGSLESVDLSHMDTSNAVYLAYMFNGCSSLQSLNVSRFSTENATDIGAMFRYCSKLTTVDVSHFNTSKVTSFWGLFAECTSLTSLDLSNFDTGSAENMAYMFCNCNQLQSLDVSHFNTQNVTDMNNIFSGCSGLTSLDVNNFNTVNVTDMSGMFRNCYSLTSLDIRNFNTTNVTLMSGMFSNCSSLTILDLSIFNTTNVTNMDGMFFGCYGLTSLDVSNFNTANVTSMHIMFGDCYSLTSLDVSKFNTANVTFMREMFSGCSGLTSLDVSNFNTTNVTDMQYMFGECSSLTSLDVSNFNTANVTSMGWMFGNCSTLRSLDVSTFNTTNVTDMQDMFRSCSGLTSLDVSNFNTANVTYMGGMFSGCSGLTSLDVSNFNTANVTFMREMFSGCSGLTSLDVSNFNTTNVSYMYGMFEGCSGLKTIYAGNDWSTAAVTNGKSMFNGCTALVGSAGTTYNANHVDHTYAHIDGGTSNPGYFTEPAPTIIYDQVFFIGSTDGWTKAEQKLDWTDKGNDIYTGFVYCADPNGWGNEFKFQRTPGSWDNEINTGTFTGGITGDFEGGSENTSNIIAKGGEGVYYVTMNLKDKTLNGVKINNMNLVGEYNGWITSDDTQQMTWNATDYCYEYTGAQVTSAGWKFAANNSWDINLGGAIDNLSIDNLVQNGINLTVVGDTIKLYPTRRTSNNIYCTFGDTTPVVSGTTIYVKSDTAPHLYAFTASDNRVLNGEFPGNEMTTSTEINGETFWTTTIPEKGPFEINMVDANGMYRTHEIYVISDRFFTYDGTSGYTDVTARYGEPREIEITSLALPGDHNEWNRTALFDAVNAGTEYSTNLDLRNFTSDTGTYTFKLFANGGAWLGSTAVAINAPNYVNSTDNTQTLASGRNITIDLNATAVRRFHLDAVWTGGSDMEHGWKLTVSEIPDTVKTPTIEVDYYYGDDLRMMTETDGAEIYYTMNGRMLQENDTDFGDGYLHGYNSRGWKVTGDNSSFSLPYASYNDSRCLKLVSQKDSTFESAQAVYLFDKFLTKGDYYTIRFKARSESGNGKMQFYCYNDTVANSQSANDTLAIGKDWADYEATVKIENDSTNQFVLNFGAVSDIYYIDNVLFGPVISDTTNQMRTRYVDPIRMNQGITVKAVAVKEGMAESKPAILDFFYYGWRKLMDIYNWGWQVSEETIGDPNVPLEFVDMTRRKMEDLFYDVHSRAENKHVDDTELINHMYAMEEMVAELENMRRGFTIDGVSYHAVDSTQVEVIAPLNYYSPYRNAITIAKEVHYNNIDFLVTSVAQNAFANTELGAIVWNPTVALKYEDVAVLNNPNLLVYVNEASLAPDNIKNIVVNKVAKNIELVDAANGNFYCPEPFSAEAISYTREFRQETMIGVSRGWEGIALPFDVQIITHENSGVITPFSRNDDSKHFWLRRLSSNGLVPADKMEANVPYIIAMPNSTEYSEEYNLPGRVTFSAANVTVPVTETRTLALADSTIMMASTMQRLNRSSRYYALNVGEVRGQYLEGSVFERDYREIRPFEAYTIHNSSNPAPRFIPVKQYGNGETTGIESLIPSLSKGEGAWYDLNGQKLQQKPTQKGVYIRNGRKVIIK